MWLQTFLRRFHVLSARKFHIWRRELRHVSTREGGEDTSRLAPQFKFWNFIAHKSACGASDRVYVNTPFCICLSLRSSFCPVYKANRPSCRLLSTARACALKQPSGLIRAYWRLSGCPEPRPIL
eukprot:5864543-Pleurochrysis_carterae.AAC.1